jgi:hypothetical protein
MASLNFNYVGSNSTSNYLAISTYGASSINVCSNGIGINTTTPAYTLDVAGTIRATGNITAFSDARVKGDVRTIEGALGLVSRMRGVSFVRTDGSDTISRQVGLIAQELLEVVPECVSEGKSDKMLSVAYGNLVGVLVEAIKEVDTKSTDTVKEVNELRAELRDTKQELDDIRARFDALEKRLAL